MAEERLPVPDPSVLTTEQLHESVARVKELLTSLIEAQEQICSEKFRSVKEQFVLVERQRVEQKEDTKAAVDAAFSAAKEAVKEQTTASDRSIAKSEEQTTRQLEQLTANFATTLKGVTDNYGDLKDRVGKIESVKQGGKEAVAGLYAAAGFVLALLVIGGIILAARGGTP